MQYLEMYDRNIGVFSVSEQNTIKALKVSIIGCGGMGGVAAQILARTGVENICIADPDKYEVVNINNQFNAYSNTIGKNKALVVKDCIEKINPDSNVRAYSEGLTENNVIEIVNRADIVFDCVDFNEIYYSYLVVNEARKQNKYVLAPQAIGYGGSVIVFDPHGMSINDYYGFSEGMNKAQVDKVNITPDKFTHVLPDYVDGEIVLKVMNKEIPIPNIALAQTLAASVMVSEALMIVLKKREPIVAPKVVSFDLLMKRITE